MFIKYKVRKSTEYLTEREIPDIKNVFLKGTSPFSADTTYFALWEKEDYLVTVSMLLEGFINYQYFTDKSIDTTSLIKKFLKENHNVKVISKQTFKEQLDKFNIITKM